MWKRLIWFLIIGTIAMFFMTSDNTGAIELEAKQGLTPAQFSLAMMYAKGEDKPQDYEQALLWFEKAAGAGMKEACFNAGYLHYHGLGTVVNKERAKEWYLTSLEGPTHTIDIDQIFAQAVLKTFPHTRQ